MSSVVGRIQCFLTVFLALIHIDDLSVATGSTTTTTTTTLGFSGSISVSVSASGVSVSTTGSAASVEYHINIHHNSNTSGGKFVQRRRDQFTRAASYDNSTSHRNIDDSGDSGSIGTDLSGKLILNVCCVEFMIYYAMQLVSYDIVHPLWCVKQQTCR